MKIKFILNNTPQKMNITGRKLMNILQSHNWKLGYDFEFTDNISIFKTKSKKERITKEIERIRVLSLENVREIQVFDENNNIIF